MESFVAKVWYRIGSRFDLLMEKNGGWISGEAHKHDVEMEDAVIEVNG